MGTFLKFIRTYSFSKSLLTERTLSGQLMNLVSFFIVYCPDSTSGALILFSSDIEQESALNYPTV